MFENSPVADFLLFCGVVKSILQIGAYSNFLVFTPDHQHRVDAQDVSFLNCVLASAVNRRAEIWEYASPRPSMHVQCDTEFSHFCLQLSRNVEVVRLASGNALQVQ